MEKEISPGQDDQDQVSNTSEQFKHFDILSGDSAISDHYYYKNSKKLKNSTGDQAIPKTVAKEWRILERDLPNSIYVRVYEKRLDLLRAMIIGAPGTPYHDGLFFFDVLLPPDYPNQPPKVYYHSHGYRLNPNLYVSGYVCLSLINTWSGKGVERWNVSNSTILQLLVSIQGLVLNDKPYFNEPGFRVGLKQLEKKNNSSECSYWTKKYIKYNEDVFIYSCKTMMHKLKRPPKGFESFVIEHFRRRKDVIFAAIEAYIYGKAVVGQYDQKASSSSRSSVKISWDFQSRLSKIHLDLRKAFEECGISPTHTDQMEDSRLASALKSRGAEKKSTKKGLRSKIMKVLKKIFG